MEDTVFYTPKEVAKILRVHRNTVVNLIRTHKLSASVIGIQYRISSLQLQEYVDKSTIK